MGEFRLLGPVEWHPGGNAVPLGTRKQRTVLAALLVDAGHPVSLDTLIDRVWEDAPPAQPRSVVYAHLTRIRSALAQAYPNQPDRAPLLRRRGGGYALELDRDRVDLHRFRALVDVARTASTSRQRAAAYREALALRRGPALADLSSPWAHRIRDGWAQLHLDTVVGWARAELTLGNAGTVLTPLTELAGEFPLTEPLIAVLIQALYAGGRPDIAVKRYLGTRRLLVEQLGIEPGPELREAYQLVLRGNAAATDPQPAPPPRPAEARTVAVPAQLPRDIPGFAGRRAELATLDALVPVTGERTRAVVIGALSGTAGVGKTALALHWARRIADRFPDGQLYVNLRGFDAAGAAGATTLAQAVRAFLDAFEVPPQRIPVDLSAQVGLYRSLLVGRRVLVVLDNAGDAEQVRPLLPGSPGCLVVVTSRSQLASLVAVDGALPLTVDLLAVAEARQLLVNRLGEARVAAEPEAVAEIIARCARLPLALAIVAARAAVHPNFPLAALAEELRAAQGSLAAFAGDDPATDLRALFSWSYRQLEPDAARLFRLLGLNPGADASVAAAASLAGLDKARVQPLLTRLARANLVSEHLPGRYMCHDLLRAYAVELASGAGAQAEREAARHRLLDHYLHTGYAAALLLAPHRDRIEPEPLGPGVTVPRLATDTSAMTWFISEQANLLAAVPYAAEAGHPAHAWQLAWTLVDFFERRGRWQELATVQSTALHCAEALRDRIGQAHCNRALALGSAWLGRYREAASHLGRSLELFRALGDATGEARTHSHFVRLWELRERPDRALHHAEQALALYRVAGNEAWQARGLNAVGWCHSLLGNREQALAYCQQALVLLQQLADRLGEAATWDSLGHIHQHTGGYPDAVAAYEHALDLFRQLGDRYNEAATLARLGDTWAAAGSPITARDTWRAALALLDELGHPDADHVRAQLHATTEPTPRPNANSDGLDANAPEPAVG